MGEDANMLPTPGGATPFERIRRTNAAGADFWSSRDFAEVLGYGDYRNFEQVVAKARMACFNSGQRIEDHFVDITEMITIGKGGQRAVKTTLLSRYACYLIVQNADPSKEIVALGQTYFAVQTRRQELADQATEEDRRLLLRQEMKLHNVRLAGTAKSAGVVEPRDYAAAEAAKGAQEVAMSVAAEGGAMRIPIAWAILIPAMAAAAACSAGEPAASEAAPAAPSIAEQAPDTWVKRSPVPGGPGSPRLGYESSWDYDPAAGKMIRWGGHDPGGGGPQLTETWAYEVRTGKWEYLQTNNNPPGNCCCRENVQCPLDNRFYRFSYPAFGHGWFWDRSRYLREDSVWTFDLAKNRWTNMRPGKEPALNVGKQACWDPNHQVFWVYDTKLRVYDPYANTWSTANQSKEIGKRDYAGMALDPTRNRLILFGDQGKDAPQTWAYDIAADRWIDLQPKGELPPGKGSGPTMVYDSRNDRMITIVLGTPRGGEGPRPISTWAYDPVKNEWQKMNPPQEPDPAGNRAQLMRYLPDLNIVILENRAGKEQQVWTYRLAHPLPPPVPKYVPTDVQVVLAEGGKASVSWKPEPIKTAILGYRVYRGEGEIPWKIKPQLLTPEPVKEAAFVDAGLKPGAVYHYCVTSVYPGNSESEASLRVRTQPKLILDSRVDVLAKDKVVFTWKPSDEKDVVGYVVERAPLRPISGAQKVQYAAQYVDKLPLEAMVERAALGAFERLTPKPIAEASFTDNVDLSKIVEVKDPIWQPYFGKDGLAGNKAYDMTRPGCPFAIYAYRIRAVNRLGVEGGPSPYQMTVPNEVEGLFAKERAEGGGTDLKWEASPHQDIKGYLVYRLNGRGAQWDKDSGVALLTSEPIKETTFTDLDEAGRGKARRYYVVVVDSLGQQGLASHGAWSRRQYWKHYEPWLPKDGWHQ